MDRRPTTQDVSWFLDLDRNSQLDLEPPYQRRSVWSLRDRRFFLDTIFRGYPSPAIFLHKHFTEGGKHVYEVVDGKQRLETILLFTKDNLRIDKEYGDGTLDGKKWGDLDEAIRRRFWDYVIPVEFIKIVEGTVVNQIFERLNRNSRKLERQELRHARNDGWFITFVENEAESDVFWKTYKVTSTARSRRMKDVQFISELLLVLVKGKVQGFDQDLLDDACAYFDAPEETVDDFDRSEIAQRFNRAKQYVLKMDEQNGCVQAYATSSINFYSLWSWVVLTDPLPDVVATADRYSTLMMSVEKLRNQPDLATLRETHRDIEHSEEAFKYEQNSRGASTEPPQRVARHEVLGAVLSVPKSQ
jgi:Protein of unknown function DUF262